MASSSFRSYRMDGEGLLLTQTVSLLAYSPTHTCTYTQLYQLWNTSIQIEPTVLFRRDDATSRDTRHGSYVPHGLHSLFSSWDCITLTAMRYLHVDEEYASKQQVPSPLLLPPFSTNECLIVPVTIAAPLPPPPSRTHRDGVGEPDIGRDGDFTCDGES